MVWLFYIINSHCWEKHSEPVSSADILIGIQTNYFRADMQY